METFYGLEDLRMRISIPWKSSPVPYSDLKFKLSSLAYTSKVLVGLLKQEYETRIYSAGFTTDVNSYKYRQVIKQF